jgi:hypothetical protein
MRKRAALVATRLEKTMNIAENKNICSKWYYNLLVDVFSLLKQNGYLA